MSGAMVDRVRMRTWRKTAGWETADWETQGGQGRAGKGLGVRGMVPLYVTVLPVVFDLSCTREPVTEGIHGLPGPPEIPAVDIAINGARGEQVRVVGREIDIRDSSAVALKRMLDGTGG